MTETRKPVVFPYETWADGLSDGFQKIGGIEHAFRFVKKGYKEWHWRRRSETATRAREAAEDAEFAAAERKRRSPLSKGRE